MFLLVPGLLFIAIACGDDDGDGDPTPTSTAALAETPTPPADGETSGADGFRRFIPTLQTALDGGDTSFLPDRALTEAIVCTADDAAPNGIGGPACEFDGQEFDGFSVGVWRSEGGIISVESAFSVRDTCLATALAAESDEFGDGSVQVYALNVGQSFAAIIMAIIERPADFDGEGPLRVAYGTDWTFEDGGWLVTSTLTAFVLAEDLLEPSAEGLDRYPDWERYEG